jgi:hypothetical protein
MNLNDAGAGSLRQAIIDTPSGGAVDFQPGLSGTIALSSGQLMIDKDLTIAGPGAGVITVSGNHASRVYYISATFTVDISGLTIANGSKIGPINPNGGAIYNTGTLTVSDCILSSNSANFDGGAIYNSGTLTVTRSTISGNSALPNVASGAGGGIYNTGTLTVMSSTLSGNSATGRVGSVGGGIANSGTLTVTDSTLSGNSVSGGLGAGYGGGIDNSGTLTITDSTLSGNSAAGMNFAGYGGGVYAGSLSARNTIFARNTGPSAPDVYGTLTSQGHNLIGNTTGASGFVSSDLLNVDPMLGALQNNGGPTQTMALLAGSPAIDAGDNTGAPMWDQRGPGFPRIEHGTIDIGAFEYHFPRQVQLDPNPVPISGLGPTLDVMQPGVAGAEARLDLPIVAPATASPGQTQTAFDPSSFRAHEFAQDPVAADIDLVLNLLREP